MAATTTRLECRENGSSKEYTVSIQPNGSDGFTVLFSYGRIGGPLKTGQKTTSAVPASEAAKIHAHLVKAKQRKGYVVVEADGVSTTGSPITATPCERIDSGFRCQLANPISPIDAAERVAQGRWWAQIKFDGERRPVHVDADGTVVGLNRTGQHVPLDPAIADTLRWVAKGECLWIDAEDMGTHLVVFDVLKIGEEDLRALPFAERCKALGLIASRAGKRQEELRFADVWQLPDAESLDALLVRTRGAGEEGVILRDAHAAYTPGRPNSGGACLKIKHTNTLSAVVDKSNGNKRSIRLTLRDEHGTWHHCGSVTIPPNKAVPPPGAVVEVSYLWALTETGSLIQPVFLADRSHELTSEAATTDQVVVRQPASEHASREATHVAA